MMPVGIRIRYDKSRSIGSSKAHLIVRDESEPSPVELNDCPDGVHVCGISSGPEFNGEITALTQRDPGVVGAEVIVEATEARVAITLPWSVLDRHSGGAKADGARRIVSVNSAVDRAIDGRAGVHPIALHVGNGLALNAE